MGLTAQRSPDLFCKRGEGYAMKQETKWPLGRQDHIEVRIISADSRDMFKKCEKFEYDVFLNPLPDQPDVHYISPQPEERITYFDKYPYTEFRISLNVVGWHNTPKLKGVFGKQEGIMNVHGLNPRQVICSSAS